MRTAQELHRHLCSSGKSSVIWCVSCLIHGCSLTCLSPRALHLPLLHLPILPHTENTQYILYISKLPQSTSCAIKNRSGVKTCRVADTRATQLPHFNHTKCRQLRWKTGSTQRPPRPNWVPMSATSETERSIRCFDASKYETSGAAQQGPKVRSFFDASWASDPGAGSSEVNEQFPVSKLSAESCLILVFFTYSK